MSLVVHPGAAEDFSLFGAARRGDLIEGSLAGGERDLIGSEILADLPFFLCLRRSAAGGEQDGGGKEQAKQ
jgi:hypothetical protein